jgi:hypothetical protein
MRYLGSVIYIPPGGMYDVYVDAWAKIAGAIRPAKNRHSPGVFRTTLKVESCLKVPNAYD